MSAMKPIPGVELKDLLTKVDEKSRQAEIEKLMTKLEHLRGKEREAKGSVAQCRKALEKAEAAEKKITDRLAKVAGGDWTVLDDKDDQKQGGQQPAAE